MRLLFFLALLLVAVAVAVFVAEPSTSDETGDKTTDEITSLTYTIQEGDTLATIAKRRWGNARLWPRIVDANPGLGADDAVQVGDTILLPDLRLTSDAEALVADLDREREARTKSPAPIEDSPASEDGLPLGLEKTIPDATVAASLVKRTDDGHLRIQGLHLLKGEGTKASPYLLTWPLLQTAGATYKPNLNERLLPQHIALLDGAWVEVSGYVAFPLPQDTSEMLVMLNQWDGCCIGVPPTPFDAIEVKLTGPVAPGQRHTIKYGLVRGRLTVEPYLIENWLVGLYLMDDATVEIDR